MDQLSIPGGEETGQFRLLHAITAIANEAPSAEWAMERAIERICSDAGWPVGHVHLQSREDPATYCDQGIWWLESHEAFRPFFEASVHHTIRPGTGFAGGAIKSRSARFIDGIGNRPGFARDAHAAACGLRTALAFPILVESRVVGVMEFFSTRRRRLSHAWLDTYTLIGTDLGRIVERKELEREAAEMAASEQRRLGREIHDTLGQQVAALEMLLKSYLRRVPPPSGEEEAAGRLAALAEETKKQVRALSRGLIPVAVGAGGLNSALEDLAGEISDLHGVQCTFRCSQQIEMSSASAASHLYRIAREGVHNALKHGKPSRIVIALKEASGLLTLQIRDDGKGPPESGSPHDGRGMRIMAHRARSLAGTVKLQKHPEGGALLTCTLRRRRPRTRPEEKAS